MRFRGSRFLLNLPLTALGVAALSGVVLWAAPPTTVKAWLGFAFLGVVAVAAAVTETRLVLAEQSTIHVMGLVGRRVFDRAQARLSFQTSHARGWVIVRLMLHQGLSTPVEITSMSSFSVQGANRRARRLAHRLAESFAISWSEDGLEAREFEEALVAQSTRTFRSVALALAAITMGGVALGFLGWWLSRR